MDVIKYRHRNKQKVSFNDIFDILLLQIKKRKFSVLLFIYFGPLFSLFVGLLSLNSKFRIVFYIAAVVFFISVFVDGILIWLLFTLNKYLLKIKESEIVISLYDDYYVVDSKNPNEKLNYSNSVVYEIEKLILFQGVPFLKSELLDADIEKFRNIIGKQGTYLREAYEEKSADIDLL